jgi:hypothetical protein
MNLFPGKKFHTINHKIDANINTVSNRWCCTLHCKILKNCIHFWSLKGFVLKIKIRMFFLPLLQKIGTLFEILFWNFSVSLQF